jgi:hypothetical protein
LVLDQSQVQRLGGRSFIQCEACKNLIWIRRGDRSRALQSVAAADATVAPLPPDATA